MVGQRTASTAITRHGRRNRGFLRGVPAVLSERKIQRKDVHRLHQGPQQAHQATQQRREERRRPKDQSPRTVVNTRSIVGNVSVSIRVFKVCGPRLLFCREMVLIVHGFPNDVSALRVCGARPRDAFFFFYCQSLFFPPFPVRVGMAESQIVQTTETHPGQRQDRKSVRLLHSYILRDAKPGPLEPPAAERPMAERRVQARF